MKLRKPTKEDVPVIAVSVIFVILMAVSSAISTLEETGEQMGLFEWVFVNAFIIVITVVVNIGIIDYKERKKIGENERKNRERELKERQEKEISIFVNIKSGGIGRAGICEMHQLYENNLFYFGNDSDDLYEMKEYEWEGAKYTKITKSQSKNNGTEKKKANGIGGFGIGAGSVIGRSTSTSKGNSSGEVIEKEVEEMGSAIIRMRRIKNDIIVSFLIDCDSEIDKKIRCFNNVPVQGKE